MASSFNDYSTFIILAKKTKSSADNIKQNNRGYPSEDQVKNK